LEETLAARLTYLFALVVLLAAGAPARADDAGDAKVHYQKATAHYAVGEYADAANEYEAAFKLKQDPALLYNAAQSHRLAGDNQKALLLYRNLVKLYPATKFAAEAKDRIDKLEQAIATSQSPPNLPAPVETSPSSTGTAQAATPGGAATAGAAAPNLAPAPGGAASPTPATTLTSSPPPAADEHPPIYKRWWFWAAAGAVVVAGVVTAVALGSGGGTWSNVPDVHAGLGQGVRW
jgi:tetratricopeptide (TPR) repeat protein